jgi:prepilin-type N-terminal cleavage/methylation domain-containing protein
MKPSKGFTLLEVILSVAALSLISIFILQMFMASARLNERAKNTDIAVTKAVSGIEQLKSGQVGVLSEGNTEVYFDINWNTHSNQNGNACFVLMLTVTKESTGLYALSATVTDIRPGEDNRVLASLDAKKYTGEAS